MREERMKCSCVNRSGKRKREKVGITQHAVNSGIVSTRIYYSHIT